MTPEDYERFVRQVFEELKQDQHTKVFLHREYQGRISHRRIKVDIAIEEKAFGASILIIVECKYYKHPVGVEDVEEFHSKLDDIGAHKGIMITPVGFRRGSEKVAKGRGIALALLRGDQVPGELFYVTKGFNFKKLEHPNKALLQGNFRPWGRFSSEQYEAGFRFESAEDMIQLLRLSMINELVES